MTRQPIAPAPKPFDPTPIADGVLDNEAIYQATKARLLHEIRECQKEVAADAEDSLATLRTQLRELADEMRHVYSCDRGDMQCNVQLAHWADRLTRLAEES